MRNPRMRIMDTGNPINNAIIDRAVLESLDTKALAKIIADTHSLSDGQETKFHLYVPAPIAFAFHSSKAKTRAFFGGNRSSKTYSHIMDYAIQFTGVVPQSLVGLFPEHRLDTKRQLRFCMGDYPNSFEKVIWPYIQELIPSNFIAHTGKESGRIKKIVNADGGMIEFMQYDQDVSKFQGASRHSIGYDEEPPEDIRKENLMRLIDTDGEETFSLTPISGALKYLYTKIFKKRGREVEKDYEFILNDKGELIGVKEGEMRDIPILGGDPNIHAFFACIFDNPAIPHDAAIRILSEFPKEEMIMRGKGHFLFLSGMIFKEFNSGKHVIPSFDNWWKPATRDNYTLYYAIDPHPRTPHAVLFMVVDAHNRKYVVDELFMAVPGPELVTAIKAKAMGKPIEAAIIDPIASTPDPFTKRSMLYDMIDFGLDDPFPMGGSKDVSHGIIEVNRTFSDDELYICDNCTKTLDEIGSYAWDDWKASDQMKKSEKQLPIKKNDHMMENMRRLIQLPAHYVDMTEVELDKYEQVANNISGGTSPVTGY